MENGMIIKKQELCFLLFCKGVKKCPGIFTGEEKQDAAQILEALFQKGWLENTGEHFHVREPLAKLLGQMAAAEVLVALYPGNPAREWTYLYPGEEIVVVQEVQRRKEAVRLFSIEKDQFRDFLREQGLTGEDDSWKALPYQGDVEEIFPQTLDNRKELQAYPWISLMAVQMDARTGERTGQIGVVRLGVHRMLVEEDAVDGTRKTGPYGESFLVSWLEEALSGGR